jgi:hypothetical protein
MDGQMDDSVGGGESHIRLIRVAFRDGCIPGDRYFRSF